MTFTFMMVQRGLSLVELMVGMALSLLLLLGLLTMLDSTQRTHSAQSGLALLQEKQRFSATLLTGIIQSAGYFPPPATQALSADSALTINRIFTASADQTYVIGAAIHGTEGGGSGNDTLRVRYQTASGDGIPNCHGNTNTTGANQIQDNVFSINAGNLGCEIGNTRRNLIDGVSGLQILYGVDTTGQGSVTRYVTANNVAAADWKKVRSAKIILSFTNPLANQPGQPATVLTTQVIQLMSNS